MARLYSTSRNSSVRQVMAWHGCAPAVCFKNSAVNQRWETYKKCVEKILSWPDDALRCPPHVSCGFTHRNQIIFLLLGWVNVLNNMTIILQRGYLGSTDRRCKHTIEKTGHLRVHLNVTSLYYLRLHYLFSFFFQYCLSLSSHHDTVMIRTSSVYWS